MIQLSYTTARLICRPLNALDYPVFADGVVQDQEVQKYFRIGSSYGKVCDFLDELPNTDCIPVGIFTKSTNQLLGYINGYAFCNDTLLVEFFVFEYYRQHFRDTFYVSSKQIHWNIEDDLGIPFLPQMQSDIMLINKANDKTLIIDTKYYSHIMQTNYDTKSYHSNNMYQIFTYVKNYDKNNTGNVSGILLYAKTDETVLPDEKPFKIGRNNFSVKTLDLNTEFSEISNRLNEIIKFI